MKTLGLRLTTGLAVAVLVALLTVPGHAGKGEFTLDRFVPDDVFLFVAQRHNPERDFLIEHWDRVLEALAECGVQEDVVELMGWALGDEELAEVDRLKARAKELVAGVDWDTLVGQETAFAERLPQLVEAPGAGVRIGPADMVWLFRGSGDGAAKNFQGLVAILEGIADEVNSKVGSDALVVVSGERRGASVATVNLTRMAEGAPPIPVSVAHLDEVVIIAVGDEILNDVLGLVSGAKTAATPIAKEKRFKRAFRQLPQAEDTKVFFDMNEMLGGLRARVDVALDKADRVHDVVLGSRQDGEAHELNTRAWQVYEDGDYAQGLELVLRAHELAPHDSRTLYYLACFHALSGNQDRALETLQRSVEAGFYSPQHISRDPDLESLRGDPRYSRAVDEARKMAAVMGKAQDVVLNSTTSGEVHDLNTRAWAAYDDGDYQKGLELVERASDLAPSDSRVLYYLACFHALTGDTETALGFLEKSVEGGFARPLHISSDPDLESLRDDERYTRALHMAIDTAAEHGVDWGDTARRIANRAFSMPSVLDYVASVEHTNGTSVHATTVAVLVDDARENPFFPVLARSGNGADFSHYLPRETESFAVSSGIDLVALYTFVTDSFLEAGPAGEAGLARWQELQEEIDFSVSDDVLSWVEGDLAFITLEGGKGSVLMVKVKDETIARDAISAGVDLLSTRLAEAAKKQPALGMLSVRRAPVLEERLEGFESLFFSMSPQPLLWGVSDGHVVFGSTPEAILACLDTATGAREGIRANERAMARLVEPDGRFSSVVLTDRRNLGKELAQMVSMVAMGVNLASARIEDERAREMVTRLTRMLTKLTSVMSKIDFIEASASTTTFDGSAWHTRKVIHYAPPRVEVEAE